MLKRALIGGLGIIWRLKVFKERLPLKVGRLFEGRLFKNWAP